MSVRMRLNRSKTRSKRSHSGLSKPALTRDGGNGGLALRHRVSPETGTYKGRQVLDVEKKKENKKETKKEKEE